MFTIAPRVSSSAGMAAWQNRNVPGEVHPRGSGSSRRGSSRGCARSAGCRRRSRAGRAGPPRSRAAATATGPVAGSATSPARVATRSGSVGLLARRAPARRPTGRRRAPWRPRRRGGARWPARSLIQRRSPAPRVPRTVPRQETRTRSSSWLLGRAPASSAVPEADDRRLAGGGEERAVLGPQVDDAVAEAVVDGVDPDVEQHPLGGHELGHPQGVVEAVAARPGRRGPGRCRTARSRRGSRGVAADISRTSGRRAHSAQRPSSDGGPGRSIGLRASASRTSMRSMIDSAPGKRRHAARALVRARARRALAPTGRSAATSRLPRAALTVRISRSPDVADGAGLRDAAALHRDRDVDVHDRRRVGVGEVLRGGPHDRPARGALEGGDGGAEAAAAEEELVAGGDARGDRQDPAVGVVRRLEPEPGGGVHGPEPIRIREAPPHDGLTRGSAMRAPWSMRSARASARRPRSSSSCSAPSSAAS